MGSMPPIKPRLSCNSDILTMLTCRAHDRGGTSTLYGVEGGRKRRGGDSTRYLLTPPSSYSTKWALDLEEEYSDRSNALKIDKVGLGVGRRHTRCLTKAFRESLTLIVANEGYL